MKPRTMPILAIVALIGLACDGPTEGELTLELVTPSNTDGAILFRVDVAESKSVTGITAVCSGCQVLSYSPSDAEFYGVVTGSLGAGSVARLSVSDINTPDAYTISILEIAGRDRRIRSDVGYGLSIVQ